MCKQQDEQPQAPHGVCPHCGYCPTCGRSNEPRKYVPYPIPYPIPYPVPPPYPVPVRPAPGLTPFEQYREYGPTWQVPTWPTGSSTISVGQNPPGYRTFTINSGGSQ